MKIKVLKFNTVKSTNNEAIKLIKKNFTKPTLITSINQTHGKGTMGKKWISKKGNLFISIYFKINEKKIDIKKLTLFNACLIKKVLKKYSKYKIKIKLPNDIYIKRKKVCGILQEILTQKKKHYLVVGIGINTLVNPKNNNFRSISLIECGYKKLKNQLILRDIKHSYEKFLSDIVRSDLSLLIKNAYKK